MGNLYNGLLDLLGNGFGPVMRIIYNIFNDYVVAIIVFTVIVRIISLPTAISQQKNQAKSQRMQLKMKKIQEKYKDDRQRLQQEQQEFYNREGYNPMSAGCSTGMIIQMPIMFGLMSAIYRPLQYALQVPKEIITALAGAAAGILGTPDGKADAMLRPDSLQIQLRITENIEQFAHLFGGDSELSLAWYGKIHEFAENFTFMGLKLGMTVSEGMGGSITDFFKGNLKGSWVYVLIPVFAYLTMMCTSLFTMLRQRRMNVQQQQPAAMTGCMTFAMPLMNAYFAFLFPVGIGIYWIVSGLVQFIQTVALSYTHPPQKMLAKVLVEETITRRSRENSRKKIAAMNE